MTVRTPEETRQYAVAKLYELFESVMPALKVLVVSLPKRIMQISARPGVKLKDVLNTADQIFDPLLPRFRADYAV